MVKKLQEILGSGYEITEVTTKRTTITPIKFPFEKKETQ